MTPLGSIHSYCSLLRMGFDGIFGIFLFQQCIFSLICDFLGSVSFLISVISLCARSGCGMWVESLQEYWNSLIPVNGKKAPVWVETVQQLASSR
ncbi:hypothetical protein NIES73_50400 (plasmid) [Sphaerospermopsis kisseleviana NIES-73]|nr:hypothetical protein NIES73_50400 [Sphaerospermopsis kisseleviana NIES-73]